MITAAQLEICLIDGSNCETDVRLLLVILLVAWVLWFVRRT